MAASAPSCTRRVFQFYCSCSKNVKFTTSRTLRSEKENSAVRVKGLLSGVRVLDLTRILAGPFASMLLGDLGAEVIKIEKPVEGDDTRRYGPPFRGEESLYFWSINRNKKSVAVDIKSKVGQEIVHKLAGLSDIVLENYPPGKFDSFNLSYSTLSKLNPRLIYCSITGYGPTGPKAGYLGYDVVAAAESGLMHITGPRGGDPVRVGVAMTDLSTGLYAYGSILASLYDREKTGKGRKVDCNLISTQVSMLTHLASNYLNAGIEGQRWGTGHQSIVPYQAFKTQDCGYIIIGAANNQQFQEFCKVVDLPDLISDSRFLTNSLRVQNRDLLLPILEKRLSEKTLSRWLELFKGCPFPYGPVNSFKQVFEDPQVKHLNLVQEIDHPAAGKIKVVGPAVQFGDEEDESMSGLNAEYLPPPLLGQHTRQVLRDLLHYSDQQIEELVDKNIIQ